MSIRTPNVYTGPSHRQQPAAKTTPRTTLLSGKVSAVDYRCTAGPGDKPFAEQHARHCIAYVRRGTFGCRCHGRSFELVVGSMLIGSPGDEYICTHDHHLGGDECLSFGLAPDLIDEIGDAPAAWRAGAVPPVPALVVLGELAQAAAQSNTDVGLEEVGVLLARRFVDLVSGLNERRVDTASPADRRRAVRAALWIAENSREAIDLEAAAKEAGSSLFHFLRVFTRVFGLTPHQYLIRRRLGQAARLLAEETMAVTEVALHVGFGDLSNFVRTFGQAAGMSPSKFRKLARAERNDLRHRFALPASP